MKKLCIQCFGALLISCYLPVSAQQNISWLGDYTGEMEIGNEIYRNTFTTVEGNDCKVEFTEYVTDKKGETENRSWIFYLSDIDPDALHFNARGRSIQVTLETRNSQKFISYFENGELDEYTDEMVLTMNEVDMTRRFIDALKEHIGACTATEASWQDREAAMDWLIGNISLAVEDDTQWEQQFSRGDKPHLATLSSRSVDNKGAEQLVEHLFDLSDIDPVSIKLVISGKSMYVTVPVLDRKRYIETVTGDQKEYAQELRIYADEIETARQIVHAMGYLISHTQAIRPDWENYNAALDYVKGHLGEVRIGDILYQNSLAYDLFSSEILDLTIRETSGEETEETMYSFYPADMAGEPALVVSRSEITVEMEAREDRDFIRKTSGGIVTGYASEVKLRAGDMEEARNLIKAWSYLFQNSKEELEDFESLEEVNTWLESNFPPLYRDDETFEQTLAAEGEWNNRINYERKVTEDGGEKTETTFIIYPEDISLEDLEIQVRLGKLAVTLRTGRVDYIKQTENGVNKPNTDRTEVYFFDPLVAKNFMEAIRFLKDHVSEDASTKWDPDGAFTYLSGHIPGIERAEDSFEQSLDQMDGDHCKLRFTRMENGKDGEKEEFNYEFTASDLSGDGSSFTVRGDLIEIHLQTVEGKDLIKPYENGEVQNFTDEFVIYSEDVLQAKRILKAFGILSEGCR